MYPEYVEVRESDIHNKGIFAAKNIQKGIKIIEYVGKKLTKEEAEEAYEKSFEMHTEDNANGAVYIFELNDEYDIDGNVPDNPAKYINHSCNPNCEVEIIDDRIWVIALRDIKKGEELTYNYGYDFEVCLDHPCECGSKNCVGFILNEDEWPKLRELIN